MNGIANKVFQFVYSQLIKQEFLSGHRSYIAGASSILGAVVLVLDMLYAGNYDEVKMGMAWAGVTLGYKIIGDAGKQERMIEISKTTASATSATALTQATNRNIATASEAVQKADSNVG